MFVSSFIRYCRLRADTNLTQCRRLRLNVLNALVGPVRDRVAAYANASILSAMDWVPILNENLPQGDVCKF